MRTLLAIGLLIGIHLSALAQPYWALGKMSPGRLFVYDAMPDDKPILFPQNFANADFDNDIDVDQDDLNALIELLLGVEKNNNSFYTSSLSHMSRALCGSIGQLHIDTWVLHDRTASRCWSCRDSDQQHNCEGVLKRRERGDR